jgi:PAS domain S-box-containing protein
MTSARSRSARPDHRARRCHAPKPALKARAGPHGAAPPASAATARPGLYESIFQATLDALLLCDDAGVIREANPAACELFGCPREAVLGRTPWEFAPEGQWEAEWAAWRHLRESGRASGEAILVRADGGRVPIEYRAVAEVQPGLRLTILRDIRQRQQAERDLAFQARLLQNVHDAIIATDTRLIITAWNNGATAMYGWTAEEALGRGVELLHSQISPAKRADLLRGLQATGAQSTEVVQYRKDGRRIVVEGRVMALRDEAGALHGYVAVNRDITTRRQAETDLDETQRRLQAIFENSTDAILLYDDQGRYLEANPAAEYLCGCTREELLRLSTWDTTPPEFLEGEREAWARFEADRIQQSETMLLRPDGRRVAVEYRSVANILPGVHLSLVRDISQRNQQEAALAEARRRLKAIFESSMDAIVLYDDEGRYLEANPAAEQLYGCTREALLGLTTWDSMPPERLDVERQGWVRFKQAPVRGEGVIMRPDGQRVPVEYRAVANILPGVHLNCFLDITERKKKEAALQSSEERFAKIFNASPYNITLSELRSGRILDTNQRSARFYGYSREEIIGRTSLELGLWLDPADRQRLMDAVDQTGRAHNVEVQVRVRSGEIRRGLVSAERLDLQGEPEPVLLSIFVDMTERLRAEEKLRQYAARLEVLAELSHERPDLGADLRPWLELAAHRAAEVVGDLCVLGLLDDNDRWVHPIPTYHARPERWAEVRGYVAAVAGLTGGPLSRSAATGRIERAARHTPGSPEPPSPDQGLLDDLQLEAVLVVPMQAHGLMRGALALGRDLGGRPYDAEDEAFLRTLAERLALALANNRLFEDVRAGRERLQAISARLVEAQESERRYIAHELHDEIGQSLTGLDLSLSMAAQAGPNAAQHVALSRELARALLARARDLSLALRPAMLDDLGLLPAMLWHIERFTAQTGIQVRLQHSGLEGKRFPPEIETGAFRVAQEALTNVARHAQVPEATVRLWAGQYVLGVQVEDQGPGFDPLAALARRDRQGLSGMRERAELLGGRLTVDSAPGQGARISADLPLREALDRRSEKRDDPHHPG